MTADGESAEQATVLIVDDQPFNIHALAGLIKEEYHVQVATGGAKALEIAMGDRQPDLILLDILMPGMDGYEVCRRLKENSTTSHIPVIFVTAKDAEEDEEMGFSLGAADYISKPFRPAIVRARVRNHMDLKIRTDKLEKLSMLDGLTDIPNRRYYEERLDDEWKRAGRGDRPLSLLMMDIDNFKAYNDHYGHGAGDECLRRVARVLRKTLSRSADFVARYGGEEFAAILPDTDAEGAWHVAEELRAAVEGLAMAHEHSRAAPVVTVSVGVATRTGERFTDDVEQLERAADQALYRAKEQGRNRVQTG
ncbi:MAG: PleD family two-component system response regulator [Synergistales bacterium]|nr:PleD family two-component system response regulator [Synergistales bacterium]